MPTCIILKPSIWNSCKSCGESWLAKFLWKIGKLPVLPSRQSRRHWKPSWPTRKCLHSKHSKNAPGCCIGRSLSIGMIPREVWSPWSISSFPKSTVKPLPPMHHTWFVTSRQPSCCANVASLKTKCRQIHVV